jgi:outer membrane protein assembly factor BamB
MTMRRAMLVVFALVAAGVRADDWPHFRGPTRDGVWRETGVLEKFPGPQIRARWRVPISSGYTSPTVAQGRVYVADRVTEPKEAERIHCFDWQSGGRLWGYSYPCDYSAIQYKAGPRAAITLYAGRAYSLGAVGHLHCFDAASGAVLWKKDLVKEFGARVPTWGMASAPLVEGSLLFLLAGAQPNASVLCLDARTGAKRWGALDDPIAYSSPLLTQHAGKWIVVCWTAKRLAGLDALTGKLLWDYPYTYRRYADGVITPVRYQDRLFVSSFSEGSLMLRLLPDRLAVEKVWRRMGKDERNTDSIHTLMCNPYIADEHIYGFDSYGEFRCLEASYGSLAWQNKTVTSQARFGTGHLVVNGPNVWIFNDSGELIISRLTPKGYEELSRAKLLEPTRVQYNRREGVTWSHPAFAYKHVFNRNDEELVCASLEGTGLPAKRDWHKRVK